MSLYFVLFYQINNKNMTREHKKEIIRKVFITQLLFAFSILYISAQISENVFPYTYNNRFLKSKIEIPIFKASYENITQLLNEDAEFPAPYRYSIFEKVNINIRQEGILTDIVDHDGKIWRYSIEAKDFKSIQLDFKNFKLPPGAKLFVYNEDYSSIYGAFTEKNNNPRNSLMLAVFDGQKAVIEYFEPNDASFEGDLVLGAIGKGYKDVYNSQFSVDEDGFVGINCPEGEYWQNEKHAVCQISFRIGNSGYTCSGSFINNTKNDGTPYFLTAHHCINENEAAETCVAYFNYEQVGCNGETISKSKSISGATIKSLGDESDYSLILFDEEPPVSYQPYFAGWDASNQSVESTVGIHHPNGLPKKMSIDYNSPITYEYIISWDDNIKTPKNTHWQVGFELGQTYSGSSGSPLFDNNKRIIGQLHGGDSENEYYGKLSHSWTKKIDGYFSLKFCLDPYSTGIKTLDAYYPAANLPDPQFYSEFSNVCTSAPVKLTAFSAFEPTAWEWDITPSTITYHESTSNTSKSPVISFDASGMYSVNLTATNSNGNNSLYMYNIIAADTTLNLEISPYSLRDSCQCNFDSLMFKAKGATDFLWSFKNELENTFQIINDTVNPMVVKTFNGLPPETNLNIDLILKGSHGSCSSERGYSFSLIQQDNDNIQDAIQIFSGRNGIYSNRCAGIEENEPVPPFTSCTGQNSWCNEYDSGEDIVEHSVWFYFIPDKDDNLDLSSQGFDNQIAVYQANSYSDILAGNYELIGANDDYTYDDPNPLIKDIEMIAGNTYWIQVDGSAGGEEGQFYLYINETTAISDLIAEPSDYLKIYPQPSTDYINIEFNDTEYNNSFQVEIYNTSGNILLSDTYYNFNGSKLFINIEQFENGIYLIKLTGDNKTYNGRFIKQK